MESNVISTIRNITTSANSYTTFPSTPDTTKVTITRPCCTSKLGRMSVTKLCILLVILCDFHHNSYCHNSISFATSKPITILPTMTTTSSMNINWIRSSLRVVRNPSTSVDTRNSSRKKDKEFEWNPLVKLPIKLVSLRHSRFYLPRSSSTFTFYKKEPTYEASYEGSKVSRGTTLESDNRNLPSDKNENVDYRTDDKKDEDVGDETNSPKIPFHHAYIQNNSLFNEGQEENRTFPKTDFLHYNETTSPTDGSTASFISRSSSSITTADPLLDTGQSQTNIIDSEDFNNDTYRESRSPWPILTFTNLAPNTSTSKKTTSAPKPTTPTINRHRRIRTGRINRRGAREINIRSPNISQIQNLESMTTIGYSSLAVNQHESERMLSETRPMSLSPLTRKLSYNVYSHTQSQTELDPTKEVSTIMPSSILSKNSTIQSSNNESTKQDTDIQWNTTGNFGDTKHKQRRRHGRSYKPPSQEPQRPLSSPMSLTFLPLHRKSFTPSPLISTHPSHHYHLDSSLLPFNLYPLSSASDAMGDDANRFIRTEYDDTSTHNHNINGLSDVTQTTALYPKAQNSLLYPNGLQVSELILSQEESADSSIMNYSTEDYSSDEIRQAKIKGDSLELSSTEKAFTTSSTEGMYRWKNNGTLSSLTTQPSMGAVATLEDSSSNTDINIRWTHVGVNISKDEETKTEKGLSTFSIERIPTTDRSGISQDLSSPTLPSTSLENDEREKLIRNFEERYPVRVWKALGFYDDVYLGHINSHWLQFSPTNPIVHKVLAILYSIIMVIGCGGNLLVIVMFIRCRSLRTPPNYLIVNLAVSDFFMMVKMPIFIYNSLYGGPILGSIGCKIYGFIGGLTGTASIMTLTAIAVDRYYVIVYPLNPLKRTTSARAILMLTAVWVYSGIFSSLPLFGINGYVSEGYLTSCSFDYLSDKVSDRIFVAIFFIAAWVFPLSIIVFSYTKIFQMVQAAERLEFFNPNGRDSQGTALSRESFKCKHDQKKQKTEIKIALLSSAIILIWLLAWTPYAIVALLGIFGYKSLLTPLVSSIPALFCKTASCVDPFLYAINHPRFQRELKNKFKFCYPYPLDNKTKKRRASNEVSCYSNASTYRDNSGNSSPGTIVGPGSRKSSPTARESPASFNLRKNTTPGGFSGTGSSVSITLSINLKESDPTSMSSPSVRFAKTSLRKPKPFDGADNNKNKKTENTLCNISSSTSSCGSSRGKTITVIDNSSTQNQNVDKNLYSFFQNNASVSDETVVQGTSKKPRSGILVRNKRGLGHISSANNLLKKDKVNANESLGDGGENVDNFCNNADNADTSELYKRTSSLPNFHNRDRESSPNDDYRRALRNWNDLDKGIFITLKDGSSIRSRDIYRNGSNNSKVSKDLGGSTKIFNGKTLNADGTSGRIKLETTIM